MTKVLLINPKLENAKSFWMPLGLAYIASYLEKHDVDVKAVDANALQIEDDQVADKIKIEPDIVGILALTPMIESAWKIAEGIKKRFPKARVVLGGHHPSVMPKESLSKPQVDIVVIGEGEQTMLEIASGKALEEINGIAYRGEYNKVIFTKPRELIKNLDDLPFPAWHLFPFPGKYVPEAYERLPVAMIFTSRGCPYRCTFCYSGIYGKSFRARSPENIVSEILYLKKHYRIQEFHIADDNFSLDVDRAKRFCELLIKKQVNLTWGAVGGLRVNIVVKHPELVMLMARSGCYRTAIGIESGNTTILQNIQKDITLGQVRRAVEILNKQRIIVGGFFMIGNYGETEKTVMDTIRFAKSLPLDYAQFMIATPYPGTRMYSQVLEEGRMLVKNWKDFNLWTGAVFEWKGLSKDHIDSLYKKAYREYFFDPGRIVKNLANFKLRRWRTYYHGFRILLTNILKGKTPMS